MSDLLLTQVINYGAPLFGLILFLGALGIPIGASVVLIAAGAFVEQGILNGLPAASLGLIRRGHRRCALVLGLDIMPRIGWNHGLVNRQDGNRAQEAFASRAGMAVYFTRFLVTALAIPTNLIAGGSGIRFRRFITYDALGELTWIVLYGGLGYLFGSQWELVSNFVSNFGGLSLGLVLLGAGIWLGIRRLRKNAGVTSSV